MNTRINDTKKNSRDIKQNKRIRKEIKQMKRKEKKIKIDRFTLISVIISCITIGMLIEKISIYGIDCLFTTL